jgi:DNA-directed RNA polymerase beta' subunit
MIYLADIEKITKLMSPVTTTDYIVGKSVNFHPEGLFSEKIFGAKDSSERRVTFSYINLHCQILHPALVKPVWILNRKIIEAIERKQSFRFDDKGELVEDENGDINGISSVVKNFKQMIDRKETDPRRIDMKNMVMNYLKNNMVFIDKCIVIPAYYRDAEIDEIHGGIRVKPINDYYIKILRQSIQLESISLTEGPMYDILASKMHELVGDLYDYIIKKISKKEGLVRQNILGKRVDFSGGAVITGASSEVKVDEIGIPFKMLVKLFEPFIIYDIHNSGRTNQKLFSELLKEYNGDTFSIPSTRRLMTNINKGFQLPEPLENLVKASVDRIIQDKIILAKRDPALHAESVQAFKPKMVDGSTIELNILKCSAYNADFDGDRMAVYVPVTKEAIQEAREKMLSSESRDSIKSVSDEFSKDVVIGLYALTRNNNSEKSPILIRDDKQLNTLNPNDKIKYDGIVTTVGKVLFNKILPSKKYHVIEPINKKIINSLAAKIYNDYLNVNDRVYIEFCHEVVKLGMKYYTIMAPSFSLSDFEIPDSILNMKQELDKAENASEASKITDRMTAALAKYVTEKETNIGVIGRAGGLKNGYSQARQILISKGLITDSKGDVRIIKNSYGDGFKSDEYFESGYGSRKGIIDRVINTSDTGYLSRQLVCALQRVEADPRIRDCRTKKFVTIKAVPDIAKRLVGRYIIDEDRKIVPFNLSKHTDQVIHLRSPIYCLTPSICNVCYGDLLMRNKTNYVGILAAEVCGERLTQTIMRTFHTGGSVSIKTIDIITEISRILDNSHRRLLEKNFVQEKSILKALSDGKIEIDMTDYLDPKKDIVITNSKIQLNYAYFRLKYADTSTDVTIDNKIEIDISDKDVIQTEESISISYKKNSIVFDCIPTNEAFSEQVKIIESLLSGKTPYKNADHFLMKIYDQYSTLNTDADLIHLEILASNLLRDKGNPSYPARLNPHYNPVVKSLKSIPKLESWLQSFAFEDPKASITTGLIYDRPSTETILEKLITGEF